MREIAQVILCTLFKKPHAEDQGDGDLTSGETQRLLIASVIQTSNESKAEQRNTKMGGLGVGVNIEM